MPTEFGHACMTLISTRNAYFFQDGAKDEVCGKAGTGGLAPDSTSVILGVGP